MSMIKNAYCPPAKDYRNWNYSVGVLTIRTFHDEYRFRVEGGAWITHITLIGSTHGLHEVRKGFYASFTDDLHTSINACLYEGVAFDDCNMWGMELVMMFRKSPHLNAPCESGDFDLRTSPIRSIKFTVS